VSFSHTQSSSDLHSLEQASSAGDSGAGGKGEEPLILLARALKARGLSYAQVGRKLGIDRQRARYLIMRDTEQWRAKQQARDREQMSRSQRERARRVREQLGLSWHSYLEARRQALEVAEKEGVEPKVVWQRWGLDIAGTRPPYQTRDLKGRQRLYSRLSEAVRAETPK
jgi:hypothetical protein